MDNCVQDYHTVMNTVLQKCSSEAVKLLSSGAIDISTFGADLFSNGFLDLDTLNAILSVVGISPSGKAFQLWGAVLAVVEVNPEIYEVFKDLLSKYAVMAHLLQKIIDFGKMM